MDAVRFTGCEFGLFGSFVQEDGPDNVIKKTGCLLLRKKRTWSEKVFFISNSHMYYHRRRRSSPCLPSMSTNIAKKKPPARIPLRQAQVFYVQSGEEEYFYMAKRRWICNCFRIENCLDGQHIQWVLSAPSLEDLESWMLALCACIKEANSAADEATVKPGPCALVLQQDLEAEDKDVLQERHSFAGLETLPALSWRLRQAAEAALEDEEDSNNEEDLEAEKQEDTETKLMLKVRSVSTKGISPHSSKRGLYNSKASNRDLLSLPPSDQWPDSPLFVRFSPWNRDLQRLDGKPPLARIPFNTRASVVHFENHLFKGCFFLRLANLENSPPEYFEGKARQMQAVVQGEFKRPVRCSDVVTGQSYRKPFKHLPAQLLIRMAFAVMRRISPDLDGDILGETPTLLSTLITTSQAILVQHPDSVSPIYEDLSEDNALFGGDFVDSTFSGPERRKYFSRAGNADKYFFKPGLIYTFDFYQHMLDVTTLEINLGFQRFDISRYLNRQPVQAMAKIKGTEEYFWNVEIWHEKLLTVR